MIRKRKIKVYNMPVDEAETLLLKHNMSLCKSVTPEHYDYRPKYIHYLEDNILGYKLFITAKSYNLIKKAIKV